MAPASGIRPVMSETLHDTGESQIVTADRNLLIRVQLIGREWRRPGSSSEIRRSEIDRGVFRVIAGSCPPGRLKALLFNKIYYQWLIVASLFYYAIYLLQYLHFFHSFMRLLVAPVSFNLILVVHYCYGKGFDRSFEHVNS